MKLAQALNIRADLQSRMNELTERLAINARTQEGMEPLEDPTKLFAEYEDCAAQLESWIAKINRTNSETVVNGATLTELLAQRDCLKMRIHTYQRFLREASSLTGRAMRSEIRVLSSVSVKDYRKTLDGYSEKLREIDGIIQETNWTTECL